MLHDATRKIRFPGKIGPGWEALPPNIAVFGPRWLARSPRSHIQGLPYSRLAAMKPEPAPRKAVFLKTREKATPPCGFKTKESTSTPLVFRARREQAKAPILLLYPTELHELASAAGFEPATYRSTKDLLSTPLRASLPKQRRRRDTLRPRAWQDGFSRPVYPHPQPRHLRHSRCDRHDNKSWRKRTPITRASLTSGAPDGWRIHCRSGCRVVPALTSY